MNHGVYGRKLSRSKNERKRLFASLVREVVLHDRIVTSLAKAKAVQPLVEKLVTRAKKGTDADRRLILKVVPYKDIADRLMADAKDRFSTRTSGFTRIVRLGIVRSDGSREAMLSFVDAAVVRQEVEYVSQEGIDKSIKTNKEKKERKNQKEKKAKDTNSKKNDQKKSIKK